MPSGQLRSGERLPTPAALAADGSVRWRTIRPTIYGREVPVQIKTQVGMWYCVAYTRLVRIVVTRDPKGRIEDRAYFTTDLSLSAAQILAVFAKRWSLSVGWLNRPRYSPLVVM